MVVMQIAGCELEERVSSSCLPQGQSLIQDDRQYWTRGHCNEM